MNKYYSFLYKYAKPDKKSYILMGICSNLISIVNLFYPFILAFLVDYVFIKKNLDKFPYIILAYLIVFIIEQTLHFFEYRLWAYHYYKYMGKLKADVYSKVLHSKAEVLDKMEAGEYNVLLNQDTENCYCLVNWFVNDYIMNIIRYFLHFICLAVISWKLCLMLFLIIPILALTSQSINKYVQKESNEYRNITAHYINHTFDFFYRYTHLKLLRNDKSLSKIISNELKRILKIDANKSMLNALLAESYELINLIFLLIFFAFINYLLRNNDLTIGEFLASYTYFGSALIGLKILLNTKNTLKWSLVSIKKIYDIMNLEIYEVNELGEVENDKSINQFKGNIEFQNVSFGYEIANEILKNINFKVQKGGKIAFVGKSGCGKTTIIKLLQKFYKPQDGKILINGLDYNEFHNVIVRKKVAVVQQDIYLFDGTIKFNLLLANPNATNKEIQEACEKANIFTFINSLPNKFDTVIGYGGIEVSGGQKQRIAIARALLKHSEIIIFDEATSALDLDTENYIMDIITCLHDITTIVITHRIKTIKDFDNIIVINNKTIAGCGKHEELLENCGIYKELYNKSR